jgi:hypothetical protein
LTAVRAAPGRRRRDAWISAAVAILACVAVRTVDPREPGNYPTCPVHALTGLACPGCGSLRALADLLHGDVPAALAHNALLVMFVPAVLASWIRFARGQSSRQPSWAAPAVVATLMIWTALRNLPAVPFDTLAP